MSAAVTLCLEPLNILPTPIQNILTVSENREFAGLQTPEMECFSLDQLIHVIKSRLPFNQKLCHYG